MAARDAWQRGLMEEIGRHARIRFGLEEPEPPPAIQFSGFWGGTEGLEAVREYYDKGTLPFAGGWFDQPAWFRRDYRAYNVVRYGADYAAEREKKRRDEAKRPNGVYRVPART
ncbi:MAG TPA: hypothetical protein PKD09_17925 [Aggregatilinea sp.]|uniref:hypothetical protein n=1 Tax=Aggregatilinea sp. TaxID=2806333 RepID=UPI002C01D448|nr:hypothetical protein [Aggregatilinea sp.]HML23540.1 hypothetical protein [Aggregatilinea sp.]